MNKEFLGVQALRFVAAALVVVTHSMFYAQERLVPDFAIWRGGTVGVDIFFVISGFVMMLTAPKFTAIDGGWKFFAMRRVNRIVPMYWIATTLKIAIMLVLPGAALHAALTPTTVFSSYFFVPVENPAGRVEPILGVGWTLTFEMMFYLVVTLAILFRANVYWFSVVVMLCFAAGHLFRGEDWPAWAVYFDQICIYFVLGMTFARLVASPRAQKFIPALLGVLLVSAAVVAITPGGLDWGREALFRKFAVAFMVLLVIFAEPLLAKVLPRWVLYMGAASYTLYLFHPMIAPLVPEVLDRIGVNNGLVSTVLSVAVSLAAAAVIYRFVESPLMLKLKKLPFSGRLPSRVQPTPRS